MACHGNSVNNTKAILTKIWLRDPQMHMYHKNVCQNFILIEVTIQELGGGVHSTPLGSRCGSKTPWVNKGVDLVFCGHKFVNLDNDMVKILGAHFSYNTLCVGSKNFVETISKIEEILSIWSYRALTLIERISVFKLLALSKILYVSSLKTVPKFITEKLDKLQKSFVWKIKHSTLIRDHSRGL